MPEEQVVDGKESEPLPMSGFPIGNSLFSYE